MAETLTDVVKFYLIPGSLSFLLLTITAAASLLALRRPAAVRAGRRLLFGVVGLYWVLSLGGVADALQKGYPPLSTTEAEQCLRSGRCAVVVLSSGMLTFRSGDGEVQLPMAQTVFNALRASQLAKLNEGPIIVSGGADTDSRPGTATEAEVLVRLLRQLGVPDRRVLIEGHSRTTHEQAQEVTRMARAGGIERLAVVSSPPQVRRAVASFRTLGFAAVGYPADFKSETGRPRSVIDSWRPTLGTLAISRDALYEYLAYGYYWARGWIRVSA